MLKIVVFDGGWGGENVANYLDLELGVVEIVRVVDWANTPYETKSRAEITTLAEQNLLPYIGTVDAIVLGGYVVSLALGELRRKYPEQIFVGMGVNYDQILKARKYPEQVVVLANRLVRESELRDEWRAELPYSTLVLPDTDGWEDLANEDLLSKDVMRAELAWDFVVSKKIKHATRRRDAVDDVELDFSQKREIRAALQNLAGLAETISSQRKIIERPLAEDYDVERVKPDLVLILNTHLWDMKDAIAEIFGWDVRVLDFRTKLLRDVCAALHLKGVDGNRAK